MLSIRCRPSSVDPFDDVCLRKAFQREPLIESTFWNMIPLRRVWKNLSEFDGLSGIGESNRNNQLCEDCLGLTLDWGTVTTDAFGE